MLTTRPPGPDWADDLIGHFPIWEGAAKRIGLECDLVSLSQTEKLLHRANAAVWAPISIATLAGCEFATC